MIDELSILTALSVHNSSVIQHSVGKGERHFNYFKIDVYDEKALFPWTKTTHYYDVSSNFNVTILQFPDDGDLKKGEQERAVGKGVWSERHQRSWEDLNGLKRAGGKQ